MRPEHPAKVWLMGYRALLKRKAVLERQRMEAYDRAMSMSVRTRPDKVQGGNATYDRMEDDVCSAIDASALIDEITSRINQTLAEMLEAIDLVPDERQRLVLTMRYIDCASWNKIAASLGYEPRQVFRLHGEGLEAIRKIKNMSVNVSK